MSLLSGHALLTENKVSADGPERDFMVWGEAVITQSRVKLYNAFIRMDSLADDEHVRYCDHPWQMTASRSVMVISQRMCAWSVKLSLTDEALFLGQLAE